MKEILFKPEEADYIKRMLAPCADTKLKKSVLSKLERSGKKIKASSAKGKGRGLQYKVCEMIAETFGIDFNQDDPDCQIHSREMGQRGTDIVLRGELRKKFPYSIECKAQETLSLPEWIRQAKTNETGTEGWLLVFKKQSTGSEPLVCMEFHSLLDMFARLENRDEVQFNKTMKGE